MKLIPTKTIKVNEIDFVVSDEPIKMNDWYIDDTNTIRESFTDDENYWSARKDYKKILCQLKSDSPIEGVQIAEEVTIEDLAKMYTDDTFPEHKGVDDNDMSVDDIAEWNHCFFGFISGYTLANKERGYSEEEMRLSFRAGRNYEADLSLVGFDSLIQSLPTKIFLLTDDEGQPIKINSNYKFVK